MNFIKKVFYILFLLHNISHYAQIKNKDVLIGEFSYLLKAKFDTRNEKRYQEFFLLQVTENKAFFASSISLKADSIMLNSGRIINNSDGSTTVGYKNGTTIPKTSFNFTIIQTNENIQYYELVGMSILSYKENVISDWTLFDESQIINTFTCKKAKTTFRGRNWIAWYAPEISLPYGPLKFSGLPGLIIKVTDDKGDFDFELVKSKSFSKSNQKLLNIKKSRYIGAIETTQSKLKEALQNANANTNAILSSYDTTVIKGQDLLRKQQKEMQENRKFINPLELEE